MPVTAAMVAIFGIEKALGSTRGKDTDATDAEGS
jgi:hypothetical protein